MTAVIDAVTLPVGLAVMLAVTIAAVAFTLGCVIGGAVSDQKHAERVVQRRARERRDAFRIVEGRDAGGDGWSGDDQRDGGAW